MKKLIVFISIFLFSSKSNSQISFFNYLDSTTQFNIYESGWDGIKTYHTLFTYFFDGDTTISGKNYYKQYYIRRDSSLGPFGYVSTIRSGPTFIREDSTGKFYNNYGGTENVLYDWAAFNSMGIGSIFPGETCGVQTIDTLYLGTRPLRRYGYLIGSKFHYMLEGFGKLDEFICMLVVESSRQFCCYTKQGNTILISPTISCSAFPSKRYSGPFLSLKEFDENNLIHVYPNPVNDRVKIDLNNLFKKPKIVISNIVGQVVFETQLNEVENVISVDFLNSGIYYLTVLDNQKRVIKKFIKN